ncbi:MAG: hypothetical protein KF884_06355 [Fimbriimonadaceae bacterium]|nr:hypothetical protein [Fimbriimonadaceae bacterium]QYK59706.1 MAG: hypothetical protein KF884_06355 [Fimbriimonadaceae bacterium]
MAKIRTGIIAPGLAGSAGNVTFVRTREGVSVRSRDVPFDPRTPTQANARDRMRRVGLAWRALSLEQAAAWRRYALDLHEAGGGLMVGPCPTGQEVFTRYGLKVLQIDQTAVVPTDPPASPFPGDRVRLAVAGVSGAVRFTADSANAPGVLMELLLQPLASIHRSPYARRYRSQRFAAFLGAGDSVDAPRLPGVYAAATRAVLAATGEAGPLLPLGLATVG